MRVGIHPEIACAVTRCPVALTSGMRSIFGYVNAGKPDLKLLVD